MKHAKYLRTPLDGIWGVLVGKIWIRLWVASKLGLGIDQEEGVLGKVLSALSLGQVER